MTRVWFLVNGILNFPGSSKNWNGRGVTHLMAPAESTDKAEKIEYFAGPIDRVFGQKERAGKLYQTMSYYDVPGSTGDYERIGVGHSNGADVFITMMRDFPNWPSIDHLHLVCGATNASFEKNGLNHWLDIGRVKFVTVYVAGRDMALRLAHTLPGKLLGYGTLGLKGPKRVWPKFIEDGRVKTVWADPWTQYGHSECWHPDNFEGTMQQFSGTPRTI